jgi:asparagine synthase (glutamine-hydrolysing)
MLQQSMLAAQAIYGAQRAFSWSDEQLSLGGGLSGFLPEDRFDEQPLWNIDRTACLIADVRLDNRPDLARELGLQQPESLADSAILMAAWQRWGVTCVDHMVGAFAFAVWLPQRREVFAARDHVGERPLYYHRGKDLFGLASMPKGLLALPDVSRKFDESRVTDWMACVHPDWHKSFFTGIERVPPGHLLRITPDGVECRQYWHPAQAAPIRFRRDEEYAEALRESFDRAVEARLRTTTQVGSQLSAGLDSGSVTASAARLMAKQGRTLTAFTAVPRRDFNGQSQPWQLANEGPAAADVARMYPNVEHVLLDTSGVDLLATMKLWTDAMDEPVLNVVNVLWITAILQQAKQRGIGVMLEGASGNGTISFETWGILRRFFRRGRWLKLAQTAHSLRQRGDISLRAAARSSLAGLLPAPVSRALMPGDTEKDLYSPLLRAGLIERYGLRERIFENMYLEAEEPGAELSRFFERFDFAPIRAAAQAVAGIDLRDPTGDKRIYEFCLAIPPEQYVVGGHSRSLVRRAMKGRLPESTLQRYTRGHQGADWYLPMAEAVPEMRREADAIEQCDAARSAIDVARLNQLLDTWPQGGFEQKNVSMLWHQALTRALSMGYFLRSHSGEDRDRAG